MSAERRLTVKRSSEESPAEEAAAVRSEAIPLPQDVQTVMLAGIFALFVFYTLYFARDIFIPLVLALVLDLLLTPAVSLLVRLRLPQALAAALVVLTLLVAVGGLGFLLVKPAAGWLHKAPESIERLEGVIGGVSTTVEDLKEASEKAEKITELPPGEATPVVLKGPSFSEFLFTGTRNLVTGLATSMILLFFFLSAGDIFLRRLVEILPRLSDKKQAVEISREVKVEISTYLVTTTIINAGVGVAIGLATWALGLPDPLLWGAISFALNYVPYLGALINIVVLAIAGLITFNSLWMAVAPAAIFIVVNLAESQIITPLVVARRLTLNPVAVFVSLILWGWMWGVPGALLAIPILAGFKIVCDHVRPLMAIGRFLGN